MDSASYDIMKSHLTCVGQENLYMGNKGSYVIKYFLKLGLVVHTDTAVANHMYTWIHFAETVKQDEAKYTCKSDLSLHSALLKC